MTVALMFEQCAIFLDVWRVFLFRKIDFVIDLMDRHNIAGSIQIYNFESELEFQNWKEIEEVKN